MEDSNRFRWASSWTTSGDLAGINSANLSGVINSASICQPDVLNISGSTSISLHENIWKSLDPPTSLVCWDETLFYIPAAFRFFGGWWVSMTMDHTSLCFRGEKKRKQVLQVLHILKLEGGAYGLMNFDPQSWDKPRVWPQPCLYSMSLCSRALQDHQTDHPGSAADPWLQHQSKSSSSTKKKLCGTINQIIIGYPWYPHDIPIHVHSESLNLSTPRCAKSWCSGRGHA